MKNRTVYFLKGLPASGKTTWAKVKIEEDRHNGVITKRVNKDELRAMLDNSIHSKERENFILEVRDEIIHNALTHGYDIIVDDTNLAPKHKERINEIVSEFAFVKVKEIFFNEMEEECIKRDKQRENSVGEKVIREMYSKYFLKNEKEKTRV